jgi:uncharacterized protein
LIRILVLLVLAFLVFLVLRALYRSATRKPPEDAPTDAQGEGEDMVACARCGVNVPRSETREADGRRVCAQNPNCR